MTKTYSSVKEVLQSGILDRPEEQEVATNNNMSATRRYSLPNPPPQATQPRRASRRGSRNININNSQSFTSGLQPRAHTADTRRVSLLSDISEDTIAIERVRLASTPPPPEEIDLMELGVEDLTRLKEEDPFMYYSIPEVRNRNYKFEENNADAVAAALLDDSNREGDEAAGGVEAGMVDEDEDDFGVDNRPPQRRLSSNRRYSSCPAGMLANAEIALAQFESKNVIKRRRLSVEAHTSVVCADFMNEGGGAALRRTNSDGSMEDGLEDSNRSSVDEEERFLAALMESTSTLHTSIRTSNPFDEDEELMLSTDM